MLCELLIRNFAIIDDLNIRFSKGLNILTGETGAGKSIIVNAVALILGSRAAPKMIRTGAETAELEALFQIDPKSPLMKLIRESGYDATDGLLVKRVVSKNDRHRVYINGHLATTQALSAITQNLASISGQFSHQGILKEEHQLLMLDQFGQLTDLRKSIFETYHKIIPLAEKLRYLEERRQRRAEHLELLQFQKMEISQARLSSGEDVELEVEKNRLKHAEALYEKVYQSIESLYGGEGAVVEAMTEIGKRLESAARIDPALGDQVRQISEILLQIEETVEALREYLKKIQVDEKRLEAVESRLDILSKLKRKYGGSIEAILSHLHSIEKELSEIEDLPSEIASIKQTLSRLHASISESAVRMSKKRADAAEAFSKKVEAELGSLRMEKTRFTVLISSMPAGPNSDPYLIADQNSIGEYGIDLARFMIAPNVGEARKPLADIASGGELSRVVLAIKAILAQTDSVETLIFDEVDAGIGGGTAEVVGKKLASLARYHQIICITHLPQIAAFADHHFRISKNVHEGRTRTQITPIQEQDRTREIARM
ncbi:MAG: DNA repair protein RecN, partial [Thermodesulfobacteriota bacterium]